MLPPSAVAEKSKRPIFWVFRLQDQKTLIFIEIGGPRPQDGTKKEMAEERQTHGEATAAAKSEDLGARTYD
ncbi:hypothetical protein V6Z11_D07G055700 [Gossypium hirsutum]